ncbi:zinc-dependent metalloprotease [Flavivirga spongiicola]|uniref:Zinc-dependent metalloprotease n=1 Tax=Flavivirga spongiicola TaxID=421621 RepID=A0ABU7XLT0_9FLAO|nr:zinc-dependent metalloprotease [Flavivirga sp. MEBiC05379]MDO5981383.1 zinc-dependent metalloprotease [Flavivirga sp. MEBiC05379]
MKCTFLERKYVLEIIVVLLIMLGGEISAQQSDNKDTTADLLDSNIAYADIIKESTKQSGFFNVYQHKKDIYFEIPDLMLATDILLVNKISQVPLSLNGHGLNKGMTYETKVIRFYKDTLLNKVWVKTINPQVKSPKDDAITKSVKDNFGESNIEVFEIETFNTDSTATLIKVNKVFNGKEKSFTDVLSNTGLGGSISSKLSKIEQIKAFPENIVIKSTMSTSVSEGGGPSLALSLGLTINMVLLPKEVMTPRFADPRIGYFSTPMSYYNDEQQQVENKRLITRWRLEPKEDDKAKYLRGELVEPKKPIVYYVDPATPKKWRPFIMQGVRDWQIAFEKAGFKNAIQVKFPSEDDKDFDGDDVRYSMITYAASESQNAMGPSIVDPRSGEILEADIIWWHNVMRSLHKWMRVQTGAIDEKARKNIFEDDYMGEAIRFVSSHEVGHTFGLKHNMGASNAYPVESLRSASFTSKMGGTAPSIMDYARFNYVAQPEDKIVEITPKIGAYDTYAINWGYRWLASSNPKQEEKLLNTWIRDNENDPVYFYGEQQPSGHVVDPRSQSEDLGDDAMLASEYGLLNLKRILPHIIEWTAEEGEDYYEASKLYKAIIDQWELYNGHVMANIGGVYLNNAVYSDGKKSYEAVPSKIQREALEYIIDNAIKPQKWLFSPELFHTVYAVRDAPDGPRYYSSLSMLRSSQLRVMHNLLKTDRLMRLAENELLEKPQGFTSENIFNTLYESIFDRTINGKSLSVYDRMTQKNYVDVLCSGSNELLKKSKKKKENINTNFKYVHYSYLPRATDAASLKRGALVNILQLLEKKKNKGDVITKTHYADLIYRIQYNLNN